MTSALTDEQKKFSVGSLLYTRKGLFMMFAWMLWGDFCFTMMEAVIPSILPLHLRGLGASDQFISVLMTSLPAVFNFTITPTVGLWSDRLRTSWGRRMPFIIGTIPFLTITLVLIGMSDQIGAWVHQNFFSGSAVDQAKVTIILLACFVGLFDLFNMFVNTIYWYLFNDIIPEHYMGRFMSYFRLVGTLAGMFYNFFIFQFAESHMREIYLGAAVLYFFGFGLMCLKVREGTYPPPEKVAEGPGFLAGVVGTAKSFWKECFTSRYYWYFMLDPAIMCLAAFAPFGVFLNKSLGLTLGNIGFLGGLSQGALLLCFLFVGRLVDKWHPVRVMAYFSAAGAFGAFGAWIWLFIEKPDPTMYIWQASIGGLLFAPLAGTLTQVGGMTRWMRILPRDKLGQFSGAMCLVRAAMIFVAGFAVGWYLDFVKLFNPPTAADPEGLFTYRYMFLFQGVVTVVAFYFHYKLYRGWKRLGGETSYQAPDNTVDILKLPPRPDDDGRVIKPLLYIVIWGILGAIISLGVWTAYYIFWNPNFAYAMVFSIATAVTLILSVASIWFIKFMERP